MKRRNIYTAFIASTIGKYVVAADCLADNGGSSGRDIESERYRGMSILLREL